MDKTKITNHQLFSLIANAALGGSVLIISALLVSIAKHDAWITTLLTTLFGIPVIWVYWFLGSQYPDLTFLGIIKKIFGKWIGSIVAAAYVFLCLTISYHLPWYISNFMTLEAMPETPVYVINSLFVIAMVIAVLYGIETIARASELFIYLASFLYIIAIIFVLPKARIENLQPVLEKGMIPILKSSVFLSSFIIFPLIILMMIYPINLSNTSKAKKLIFKGYLWASFIIFIVIIVTILVLGGITARLQFPTYLLAKEINVGIIFTRLEFIIAVSWLITQFMIGLMFFYSAVIGISELLGLKDYRRIVMPLGLIILVMSGVVFPDVIYQANWVNLVWPPFIMTYGLILPVLLLFVFLIKKWVFKGRKS